ncbi:MAPEG family protein [Burkholderia latens]|uniref:MAPEG family protein n=1 Tax=Burkholderia latens TaxID=488446 RepID=UPI00158CFC09|nr:MAPEG family protein [Burkholderia latens]
MSIHPVALVCTAILGALLFGLGLFVSVTRFRHTTGCGCASDPDNGLYKVVRAHGNTAEYAPFLAVLFLYFGAHDPSRPVLSLIVAATASRCLLVIGLLAWPTMAKPNPARFVGAFGTYLCGAALCVAMLL